MERRFASEHEHEREGKWEQGGRYLKACHPAVLILRILSLETLFSSCRPPFLAIMSSPAPKAQTGHTPSPPDAGTGQARNPPETQTDQAHNPQEAQTGSTSNPVNVQTDQAHNPPEALEADDFGDETYATDDESAVTSSITSSIEAYRQENGRTYHSYKDGSYLFPNDEDESDRLDFQHAIFLRSLRGQLYLAPIPEDVQNVLDIGTGTGIWAIDFADEFPSARVIGTDLSPTQPNLYAHLQT